MERACTKSRCLIITGQPAWCAAAPPMIFSPFPANRMSRSWKPRRALVTLCRAVCRADARSPTFSINTPHKQARRFCIPKNHSVHKPAAGVTPQKEKNEQEFLPAMASRTAREAPTLPKPQQDARAKAMIREGLQSTNQSHPKFVQEKG